MSISGVAMDKIIKEAETKMQESISHLAEELKKIRTGRAHTSLVEDLKVSYYGTMMSLREVATLSAPEPGLIAIKPFDRNAINDIESAIRNSGMGLNPINDGNFVRISLPPLTEERRSELAKQVKRTGEAAKVALRTIRGEAWEQIQRMVKNSELTEDDKYSGEKRLNDIIEKMNSQIDDTISGKEKEIMSL